MASGLTRKADAMRDRVEAEHGLQHQRRVHGRIDRRMRADEQQFQPLVGKFGCRHQGAGLLGGKDEVRLGLPADRRVAGHVDRASPRHRQQPGLGIVGDAVARPGRQRRVKGVGQAVLRRRHVARAGGEEGKQPAVGPACRLLDRLADAAVRHYCATRVSAALAAGRVQHLLAVRLRQDRAHLDAAGSAQPDSARPIRARRRDWPPR